MDLRDFLAWTEAQDQLVRVETVIDPAYEVTEIVRRLCGDAQGGPVVLFERLQGSEFPVAFNLLGHPDRIARSLRVEHVDEAVERLAGLLAPDLPEGWLDSLQLIPRFRQLLHLPPKPVDQGICQQVLRIGRDVNLFDLPVCRYWPGEATATLTRGECITRDRETRARHTTVGPVLVRSQESLQAVWHAHQPAAADLEAYRRHGEQMPVAIAIGGDPAALIAALAPLPRHLDPALLTGFLRDENVPVVRCRTHDLMVPADCEFVIEGLIDPLSERTAAGPVALETGYYGEFAEAATIQVTAITHRANPVFLGSVPDRPPSETSWIEGTIDRLLLPFVRLVVPEIVALGRPSAGLHRNFLFVSLNKTYPRQARKVMQALWGLDALMFAKTIVVCDADVDVTDADAVWQQMGLHAHPARDLVISDGPAHPHDHAAPEPWDGSRLGIDATAKLPGEGHPRGWPTAMAMNRDVVRRVSQRWQEWGLPGGEPEP